MKFFIGTTNQYKIQEIASILRPLCIDLEVTFPFDPEETGDTFEENAEIKARYYSEAIEFAYKERDKFVICEDSGLSVPAIDNLPGPWSARFDDCIFRDGKLSQYFKSNRTRDEIDVANVNKVIRLMQGKSNREASIEICLAVATKGNVVFRVSSFAKGWIAEEPRGSHGFGYDPIFISDRSFGKTWAEIDGMRKNLISHRRKAIRRLTQWIVKDLLK